MCKSNCQGTCKSLVENNDDDQKELLAKVIDGLEKVTRCSTPKPGFINSISNSYMIEMNTLKAEAKLLLEEVNCYDGSGTKTGRCNPYMYENAYEEYSLKERIKMLKQKVQLLEKSLQNVAAVSV
ncbi:MAG: hypothetical protein ABIN97_19245 [Ginsengibacter sp.]